MPTSLASLRTELRTLLKDGSSVLWTDAELAEAITAALEDFSRYVPRERSTTAATTINVRDVSVSAITDRQRIVGFELPTGSWPKNWRRFSVFGDTLTVLDDPAPDGTTANVYYEAVHVINGTTSLPVQYDEIVKLGAAQRACEQMASDVTNALNDGGGKAPDDWERRAKGYQAQYEERRNPLRGVRVGSLSGPDEPLPSQSSDPGP